MSKLSSIMLGLTIVAVTLLNSANAANSNKLTPREEVLWNQAFADGNKATTQQKTQSDISGNWVGYYEYDKPSNQPPGMFNAVIKDLGDQFLITFLEPSNHQDKYVQWGANSSAKRQGKYIEFTKHYGHNDTKIQYNLTISHYGAIMDGTWKINGNAYGRAFFYRVPLQDLKNLRQEAMK